MTEDEKHTISFLCEKGTSCWLTTLPLADENFVLNRMDFRDALKLRYSLPMPNMPSKCVCGKVNNISHALSCSTGGYVARRHNNLRDFFGRMLSEISYNVRCEPVLAPIDQQADPHERSRLDIAATGFWRFGQNAFFDIRVFNPLAASNTRIPQSVYESHENEKIRKYEQRVLDVEHGSFTPLVFSALGGCSNLTKQFMKQLSTLLSQKRDTEKSKVTAWLRTKINFSLLRSVILCIRGSRGYYTKCEDNTETIAVACQQAHIN